MKKILLAALVLICPYLSYSQQFHTSIEILKLLTDSKIKYGIATLEKPIECNDYSDLLTNHDCFREKNESGFEIKRYKMDEKTSTMLDKAEKYFQSYSIDSAMFYYNQIIEIDPSLSFVMTYIGQGYRIKEDYKKAIYWYKKAIETNYLDYMAHWFLANMYEMKGDLKEAVDEITIAHILNRNNPRLKTEMKSIFANAGREYIDWCFNPQFEMKKFKDDSIMISITREWVGYAMTKALWTYEPGYRESMGAVKGKFTMNEEKECLFVLITSLENIKENNKKQKDTIENNPQFSVLKEAAYAKHIQEYIIYEILLPKDPSIAFQLPEENILEIKDYLLNYRFKEKK